MYFKNILGQDIPKKFIINSIKKDRISHAYIFEGINGIGKRRFALEFSKLMLDINNLENSPDFNILSPEGSSFKIEQIRNMQSNILIKPYGNKKIYILEDTDKMTIQAQNSLLKTLEEPPPYAIIILLCENNASLLDTIKSRCEIIKFSPLSQVHIEEYLIKNKNIELGKARVAAAFSIGVLSKAIELIESDEFNKKREEIENIIEMLMEKNIANTLNVNSYLEANKENIKSILDMMMTYFRDIMIIKEEIKEDLIINLDKIDSLRNISKKLTYSQVSSIIDIIKETNKKLISNCNFNLTVQVMVLNIQEVIK